MASDVMFEGPKMFGEFDSNGEMFMTGGVMDPKELYLSGDLKDTKDSTSSSDSGISNLDDVADFDNVTDLHLDAEFKDLDFSFDIDTVIKEENILFDSVPKLEDFACALTKDDAKADNFFNPDNFLLDASGNVLIKSEPLSPSSSSSLSASSSPLAGGYGYDTTMTVMDTTDDLCGLQEQLISPDFYTVYDDGSLVNPDSPIHSSLLFSPSDQERQQLILQQPRSESKDNNQLQQHNFSPRTTTLPFSPHSQQVQKLKHGCIIQPSGINTSSVRYKNTALATATTPQQYSVVSVSTPQLSSPGGVGISSPTTCSPNSLPGQVIISPKSVATVITAPKFTQQQQQSSTSSLSSSNHQNILVLPNQIKQEFVLSPSSSLSSPSSPLSSPSLSPPLFPASSTTISIPMGVSTASSTSSLLAKPAAAINLNAILSSKKKIQPKPDLDTVTNTNQWLSSKVPLTTQAIAVAPGPAINSSASLITSGNCALTSITDSKSLKRAQRIIKNRESASLSRKRKKEYLSSLEDRLQQCADENRRLQKENHELKQKLESLLTVNTQLKTPIGLSPAKKVCLLCFALFLAVNISGFSLLSSSITNYNQQAMSVSHGTGRQLLSLSGDGRESDNDIMGGRLSRSSDQSESLGSFGRSSAAWLERAFGSADGAWSQQDRKEILKRMNWTQATHDMCANAMAYINATESIRLAEQLTGWMQEEEKKRKKKEEKKKMGNINRMNSDNKANVRRQKHYPTLRRFASATAVQQQQQQQQRGFHSSVTSRGINSIGGDIKSSFALQVFNGPDQQQQFLNAIPRRNDTFYVLSFSTDYLLVPATAHNKTMRPRMSLLMPVLSPSLNDSRKTGEESVAMMQIDCEIINTNLIHIHRSAFPKEPTINGTSFGKGDSSPTGRVHNKESSANNTEADHQSYWAKLKGSRK